MATVNLGPYKLKVKPKPTRRARGIAAARKSAKTNQARANRAWSRGDTAKGHQLDRVASGARRAVRVRTALNQREFQQRIGGLVANPNVRKVLPRFVRGTSASVTPPVHLDLDKNPSFKPKALRDGTQVDNYRKRKKLRLI